MQLTIRMPDEYTEKLNSLSKKMGLKRSDIIRLALKQFFEEDHRENYRPPFQKVSYLLGTVESGTKDLGKRHRDYLIQKIRRGS
jgi:metal-responsive CopG/Arc/MetJ family transcriptional regulator